MAYIPDITERFPEGYGGVDMTDRFQIGSYDSTDRLIYERSMEEASKVPLDDFKHFKDSGFDRDGFHFNIESSWDGDTYSYSLYLNGDCRLRSYEPITDKDIDFAIKSFLKEYPEAKEWYSYKHAQGTKLLEKWCDNENVPKNFQEIVEDSYEFENGLLLIVYEDKEHEIEKEHICIDLDHLADYEDFSMIQNDFAKYKRSSPEIRLRVIGDPDLAQMLAKSTLAWDEIESIGRILFDKDYIDKYPSCEKAIYGGGLSESELYNQPGISS